MSTDSVSQIAVMPNRPVERVGAVEPAPRKEEGKVRALHGKDVPPEADDKREPKAEELAEAVSDLNDYVQSIQRDLQFSIDEASGRTIIKVIDSESKEVIRQIPPEEALSLARNLERFSDATILQVKA